MLDPEPPGVLMTPTVIITATLQPDDRWHIDVGFGQTQTLRIDQYQTLLQALLETLARMNEKKQA